MKMQITQEQFDTYVSAIKNKNCYDWIRGWKAYDNDGNLIFHCSGINANEQYFKFLQTEKFLIKD